MYFPIAAISASPKDDFANEQLLDAAIADIEKMSLPEVETFIHYLASCTNSEDNALTSYECGRARESYLIKYSRKRSIDRLVSIQAGMWKYVEAKDKLAKKGSQGKDEVGNLILRYVEMAGDFSYAASKRFQVLSGIK